MYSTSEVSEILKNRGYDISSRSINYYVYDKKMFEVEKGKKSFTENEIEKLILIKDLQQYTTFNLTKIKKIISDYSTEEIREIIRNKIGNAESKGYSTLNSFNVSSISNNTFNGLGGFNDFNHYPIREVTSTKISTSTNIFNKCIVLIDNEVIIKTNKTIYNEELIKEIKAFIEFKLTNNKYIENNDLYTSFGFVKLDNEDNVEFLNVEKYKDIQKEIIDFINYKIK